MSGGVSTSNLVSSKNLINSRFNNEPAAAQEAKGGFKGYSAISGTANKDRQAMLKNLHSRVMGQGAAKQASDSRYASPETMRAHNKPAAGRADAPVYENTNPARDEAGYVVMNPAQEDEYEVMRPAADSPNYENIAPDHDEQGYVVVKQPDEGGEYEVPRATPDGIGRPPAGAQEEGIYEDIDRNEIFEEPHIYEDVGDYRRADTNPMRNRPLPPVPDEAPANPQDDTYARIDDVLPNRGAGRAGRSDSE